MLKQWIGQRGERRAESFLHGQGLKTVTRNWRCRQGEIDLVMHDGESLVFVEVRTRAPTRFADGVESIDRAKRRKLVMAAQVFLMRNPEWNDEPCRFDVIGIDGGRENEITWIVHAFEAE